METRIGKPFDPPDLSKNDTQLTHENPVEKEPYEQYKEKFIAEKILPYATNYDYSKFNDNDFIQGLRDIKESYQDGDNTYNVDSHSFSIEELESMWQVVDSRLRGQQAEREKKVNSEEATKIASGKWRFLPDGALAAKAKNPCVIGGVHGDETTLPKDMEKALETQRAPLLSLDTLQGYSNWRVNPQALDHNVRAFSTSLDMTDEASDMNRMNIDDSVTKDTKEKTLDEIAIYDTPFLLDCHNDNSMANETNSEKKLPFAYITDVGDVDHKISLAGELGLHRVIIIPQVAMAGSMVESLRKIKPQSDGMTVEVDGSDTNGTSAKIALRFLQMSKVLNNHRPSNGVQILHEFQTTFLPTNPNLKIFKMDLITEDQLGMEDSAHYTVIDGKPIKITRTQTKDGVMLQLPITEEDKKLF